MSETGSGQIEVEGESHGTWPGAMPSRETGGRGPRPTGLDAGIGLQEGKRLGTRGPPRVAELGPRCL